MVLLAGTPAYIGSMSLICSLTLVSFLHQPITSQHSPVLIDFSVWWVEVTLQIKGKSPAGTNCWYSAHAAVGGDLVEYSETM